MAIFLILISISPAKAQEIILSENSYDQLPDSFYLYTPVYTNVEQTKKIYPITYIVTKVDKQGFLDNLSLGLYLCSTEETEQDSVVSYNVFADYPVFPVIKKESEGYIGYLEEMINVPFVLPPRRIKEGHQTDLRLGVDCAELAIYGMRRLGFNIPYVGPKRIVDYLTRTEQIERGSIISFGNNYQISVVYEDRGVIGELDEDDLLIHAYKDKAEIVRFGDTNLTNLPYRYYYSFAAN